MPLDALSSAMSHHCSCGILSRSNFSYMLYCEVAIRILYLTVCAPEYSYPSVSKERGTHCLLLIAVEKKMFQVAERALFLWNNDHLMNLIAQNRQVILPLIYPALERNARCHWNQSVLNVTMNIRKMFSEMDGDLFLACQRKFQEEEEKRVVMEEKRKLIWERLETAATFQPVTRNTAVLVTPVTVPLVAATLT